LASRGLKTCWRICEGRSDWRPPERTMLFCDIKGPSGP